MAMEAECVPGDGGVGRVWAGEALYEGMYDVLGGDASTLTPLSARSSPRQP